MSSETFHWVVCVLLLLIAIGIFVLVGWGFQVSFLKEMVADWRRWKESFNERLAHQEEERRKLSERVFKWESKQ